MIRVVLNGAATDVEPGTTLGQLVDRLTPDRSRVAVERNKSIVPRATLDETEARNEDIIEVVTLVGGG